MYVLVATTERDIFKEFSKKKCQHEIIKKFQSYLCPYFVVDAGPFVHHLLDVILE